MKTFYLVTVILFLVSCKNSESEPKIGAKKINPCNCINDSQVDSIVDIGFGFKGKLSFFFKKGFIRKIKAKTVKKLHFDLASNKDSLKKFIESPKFYERFLCFNEKNELIAREALTYNNEYTKACYDSEDKFVKESSGWKKIANSGRYWDYTYSINLLESYIFLSKLNYNFYPKSLGKYSQIFNQDGIELVIGHSEREIARRKPIKIYDNSLSVIGKDEEIDFTYIPKILKKGNKVFLKIYLIKRFNEKTDEYEKEECYIDLKSILTDPEFLE